MSDGISIRSIGLKELMKRVKDLPKEIVEEIDAEVMFAAQSFLTKAASLAPGGNTLIRQGLVADKIRDLLYEVRSNSGISAYLDFGTGQYAASYVPTLPNEVQQYARTFYIDGSGTQKQEPFFFINFNDVQDELEKNITNLINNLDL